MSKPLAVRWRLRAARFLAWFAARCRQYGALASGADLRLRSEATFFHPLPRLRLKLCEGDKKKGHPPCAELRTTWEGIKPPGTCRACGCAVRLKVQIPRESCPIGRWKAMK